MPKSPIFIIGTERSGTNLLRLILNSHENITVPHPPHIMRNFNSISLNFKSIEKLVDAVLTTIKLHPHPWEFIPTKKEVLSAMKGEDLISIFLSIYDYHLKKSLKQRWCCKSTFMVNHVEEVIKYYPNAKFILMVRDPRDVCVSAKKSIFNNFHPWLIAQRWNREQQQGLESLQKFGSKQIHLLHYEALLDNSKETILNLCDFLEEPFKEEMLSFFNTKDAEITSKISQSWENANKPILKENKNKFKKLLNESEIKIIESICANQMTYLNYKLMYEEHTSEDYSKYHVNYIVIEKVRMFKVQLRAMFKDKHNFKRYLKYWYLQFSWML